MGCTGSEQREQGQWKQQWTHVSRGEGWEGLGSGRLTYLRTPGISIRQPA